MLGLADEDMADEGIVEEFLESTWGSDMFPHFPLGFLFPACTRFTKNDVLSVGFAQSIPPWSP